MASEEVSLSNLTRKEENLKLSSLSRFGYFEVSWEAVKFANRESMEMQYREGKFHIGRQK